MPISRIKQYVETIVVKKILNKPLTLARWTLIVQALERYPTTGPDLVQGCDSRPIHAHTSIELRLRNERVVDQNVRVPRKVSVLRVNSKVTG